MPTVLVVDDSSTEREIISGCLKGSGLNIVIAESGEQALEKISTQKPDIIVLDVVLPGRSGFEICRELKAEDSTSSIPIIICSTKSTEMDKFWGLKQGADAYITKPIDQDELVKTVNKLL
jgi:DNA-binding response OmpR family regulator